jgi:two-component system, OmpR family, sensor histidine kinase TctE
MKSDGRKYRSKGLRKQMALVMAGGLSASIVASLAFFYFESSQIAGQLEERSLFRQTRLLLKDFAVAENGRVTIKLPPQSENAYKERGSTFAYTIFDREGRPVAVSPNIDAPLPFFSEAKNSQAHVAHRFIAVTTPSGHVLVLSRRDAGASAVARSLILSHLIHFFLVWLALILLAIPMIWYIIGWNLRWLRRASEQATAIGPLSNDTRIITDDLPSEIMPLVEAFNGALDRLTDAYHSERRLTADAAHELRTPIAVLNLRLQRGQLNGHIDWPAITRDMGQLRRLLDQMLDLARKDRIDYAEQEIVPLPRLVRETTAMVLPIAEEKGREITVDARDDLMVFGSPDNLRDMLRNLLENALFHGTGSIRVTLGTGISSDGGDNSVVMEVTDEGAGVPPGKRDLVFERFSKGIQGSPGAGLGLTIVRQVVRMHGGTVSFVPVSSGCCVRVVLPRAVTSSEDSVCNERTVHATS